MYIEYTNNKAKNGGKHRKQMKIKKKLVTWCRTTDSVKYCFQGEKLCIETDEIFRSCRVDFTLDAVRPWSVSLHYVEGSYFLEHDKVPELVKTLGGFVDVWGRAVDQVKAAAGSPDKEHDRVLGIIPPGGMLKREFTRKTQWMDKDTRNAVLSDLEAKGLVLFYMVGGSKGIRLVQNG